MELDVYSAFVVATAILIALPGPSVLLTVAHSISFGWRTALVTVAGATAGVTVQLLVAAFGLSSMLHSVAEAFEWLRLAGAAYLVYLGIRQWRGATVPLEFDAPLAPRRNLFVQGLVITVPNPKSLIFIVAFLPQFIDATRPLGLQFAELPLTDRFSHELDAYRELKDRLGMYYLCHGPREGDPNDTKGLKEVYVPKILATFPLMKRLEASLLTIHLWLDSRFVKEEVISFKVGILREILARAEQAGVVICLENLSESASHLQVALDPLPQLCLTLDLGHAQLLTEVNRSDEILAQYPDRIMHVHLHDNRGGHSPKADLHLPIGEGVIDFRGVFSRLRAMGYDRTITLELKPPEIEASLPHVRKLLGLDS